MASTVPPNTASDSALDTNDEWAKVQKFKAELKEELEEQRQAMLRPHKTRNKDLMKMIDRVSGRPIPRPRDSSFPRLVEGCESDLCARCGRHNKMLPCLRDRLEQIDDDCCANCGEVGHKMDHCLKVPEGLLYGCVLCNNMTHDTDACAVFTAMSFKDQVDLLIYQRGSMPALRTEKPWAEWLREWSARPESREEDGSFSIPSRLPWSKTFTIDLAYQSNGMQCQELQKEYDQHKDIGRLPIDPASIFPEN